MATLAAASAIHTTGERAADALAGKRERSASATAPRGAASSGASAALLGSSSLIAAPSLVADGSLAMSQTGDTDASSLSAVQSTAPDGSTHHHHRNGLEPLHLYLDLTVIEFAPAPPRSGRDRSRSTASTTVANAPGSSASPPTRVEVAGDTMRTHTVKCKGNHHGVPGWEDAAFDFHGIAGFRNAREAVLRVRAWNDVIGPDVELGCLDVPLWPCVQDASRGQGHLPKVFAFHRGMAVEMEVDALIRRSDRTDPASRAAAAEIGESVMKREL